MAQKITLKLAYGDDLRRVTVDVVGYTFAELQATIGRLFGPELKDEDVKQLHIKYLDDEDDLVTISSNEELAEAFELTQKRPSPILRLSLNKPVKKEAEKIAAAPLRQYGGCPARHGGCPARCSAQDLAADLPKTLADPRHEHTLQLTMAPYDHGHFICDGCQLSGRGVSYQCEQCQYDLHVNCEKAREQHLANPWEKRQLWLRLHHQAMEKMEQGTVEALEKARDHLKEQVEISVYHRATPIYNLACVEAQLGNLESALSYLQEAVTAGWSDVAHLKADKDLDNLRNLDGYKALVTSLEGEETEDEAPERTIEIVIPLNGGMPRIHDHGEQPQPAQPEEHAEVDKEPVKKEAVKAAVEEPRPDAASATQTLSESKGPVAEFDEKLKTLAEMGWTDRRKNISTLVRTRGDLVAAVQILLDEVSSL